MESTISKLSYYRDLVNETPSNDFIDFLCSQKIINEDNYLPIYELNDTELKLQKIFEIIESKSSDIVEKVFAYLDRSYPNNKKVIQDGHNFRISSVRGEFPQLPPNYVTRKSLVKEIKSKLLSLQWNQKLVIHGMMGYGKSCSVNEVLNDPGIRKRFDYLLFWINLGECRDKEMVWLPLRRLYTNASKIVHNNISHCPDVQILEDFQKELSTLFLDPILKNALIILDDVSSLEVLTCFDISCKTVITTQDRKVIGQQEGIFVEVKTGFSRTESLELFKKSVGTSDDLPETAEQIHDICKGHPMLIALIGSYLKENAELVLNKDIKIWEYVKNMFARGDYNLNEFDNRAEIPTLKIKKCIKELLSNGLEALYEDLAIFMPDVNIPSKVLQILWNESSFVVLNKMNKFAEKSLVVRFYHNDLGTYIYGIHDIHLNYLKDVTKKRTVSLHKQLIDGYDRITHGNYAALPNDNYTLQFIGYHLHQAEEFRKFDIYFDLRFLEAKIKAVGKEDVLKDMSKYERHITRDENVLREKLEQYRNFIKRCGNSLYSYEKTDIIQYALREGKDSVVFRDALLLAEDSRKLFFQLQRPVNDLEYSTINIKDDVTCACFVNSPRHILIGTAAGKIKLFHERYDKEIWNFVGHNSYVKKLIMSPDRRYFLSVSFDGKVMLWKIPVDSARNSWDFSNHLPVSPKIKQPLWQDVFTPERGRVLPTRQFEINEPDNFLISAGFCEKFPHTFEIATGTNRGSVIIWDAYNGDRLYTTGNRGYPAPHVIYQENEFLKGIVYICDDNILLYQLETALKFKYSLYNRCVCEAVFVSDDKIFAVGNKNITLWVGYQSQRIFEEDDSTKQYICSTVTDDSNYLVVSTDKGTVKIWNIKDKELVKEFECHGLAKSLDTFYDEERSVHILLMGSDQKSLQLCYILPCEKEPYIAAAPKFIPFWKKKYPLTALVSKTNQIQVFNGYVQFSETGRIGSPVTCTCFSACGQNVLYGLENGEVHVFSLRSKKTMCLENNGNDTRVPITYLYCYAPVEARHQSLGSYGSGDMDFKLNFEGIIVSVSNNDIITVYYNDIISSKEVKAPLIYYDDNNNMIVVDSMCKIYVWNLLTTSFKVLENPTLFESVRVSKAAFCSKKSILAVVYKQMDQNFLDVYQLMQDNGCVESIKRMELDEEVKSCCLSYDGSLLAVGMSSGDIKVWNLVLNYKSLFLKLHNSPVEDLLFSPSIQPPILVSLGEYIAWWNLKSFQEDPFKRRGRPESIEILDDVVDDFESMNISHWADRKYIEGTEYLLSCLKLNGCAKYLSASRDFNTFLSVDDKGKIYVMEIVSSPN